MSITLCHVARRYEKQMHWQPVEMGLEPEDSYF